eukprot:Nk52_evm29s1992 gene=Nk52_evmTU29s1992
MACHSENEDVGSYERDSFHSLGEKPFSAEVTHSKWCPSMDIIAVCTSDNEIWVHRLSWQKIWNLSDCSFVPAEDRDGEGSIRGSTFDIAESVNAVTISALEWSPDGLILATALSDGRIFLYENENGNFVYMISCPSRERAPITSLQWLQLSGVHDIGKEDYHSRYFGELPKLSTAGNSYSRSSSEHRTDILKRVLIEKSCSANILISVDSNCVVRFWAMGVLLVFTLNLNEVLSAEKCRISLEGLQEILTFCVDPSLETFSAVLKTEDGNAFFTSLPLTHLSAHKEACIEMAFQYWHCLYFVDYLEDSIASMTHAWEDILVGFDSKLQVLETPGTSVEAEFLSLLTRGQASLNMMEFLNFHLKDLVVKKLGNSVEVSYSNIEKLTLEHLHPAAQAFMHRLGHVKGQSSIRTKFENCGLYEDSVAKCMNDLGEFVLKSEELLQVTGKARIRFKAFFNWLHRCMYEIKGEEVPGNLQTNEVDRVLVAEFLKQSFNSKASSGEYISSEKHFASETVGQYFLDNNLHTPFDHKLTKWDEVSRELLRIEKISERYDSPLVEHNLEKSLLQTFNDLKKSVKNIFCGSDSGKEVPINPFICVRLDHCPSISSKQCDSRVFLRECKNEPSEVSPIFLKPCETKSTLVTRVALGLSSPKMTEEDHMLLLSYSFPEFGNVKGGALAGQFEASLCCICEPRRGILPGCVTKISSANFYERNSVCLGLLDCLDSRPFEFTPYFSVADIFSESSPIHLTSLLYSPTGKKRDFRSSTLKNHMLIGNEYSVREVLGKGIQRAGDKKCIQGSVVRSKKLCRVPTEVQCRSDVEAMKKIELICGANSKRGVGFVFYKSRMCMELLDLRTHDEEESDDEDDSSVDEAESDDEQDGGQRCHDPQMDDEESIDSSVSAPSIEMENCPGK